MSEPTIKPVMSLSTYQAPVEAVRLLRCPRCFVAAGVPCQRKNGDRAMEQHEERWRPLQDAHDAGFVFARAQYEGIVSQYKDRVNASLRTRRGGAR